MTPFMLIFKKSIDTSLVPDDWRKAQISDIVKKSDKCDPGNYRPVKSYLNDL